MDKTQNFYSGVKFERNVHLLNGIKINNSTEYKIYRTKAFVLNFLLCAKQLGKMTSSNYNYQQNVHLLQFIQAVVKDSKFIGATEFLVCLDNNSVSQTEMS